MSDKELDRLFQSRFEDFEVEPSPSLWGSIEEQLDKKAGKKRKQFPVFWMAAASLVVAVGAGLWILNADEKIYLQGKEQLALEKPQETKVLEEQPESLTPSGTETVATMAVVSKEESAPRIPQNKDISQAHDSQGGSEVVSLPPEPLQEAVMASATDLKYEVGLHGAVVAEESVHDHTERGVVHSTVLAMLPDEASEEAQTLQQRRKIKSVGDIVNFVVAKVDQRENKLIEMTEDDEGTRISGINLGVFKLKSRKK